MVQIKITNQAKKDISAIYNYILQDSYQNAEMIAEALIRKIDTLKHQPLLKLLPFNIAQDY